MNKSDETKVIVLGGLGEVGRNMYCVMHKDEIIILDAGVSFAGDLLGIDYVLPDYSFLKQNEDKIKALLNDIAERPYAGIGKPEPLKYELAGKWSRRINSEHRLIYSVHDDMIEVSIFSMRHHYSKK